MKIKNYHPNPLFNHLVTDENSGLNGLVVQALTECPDGHILANIVGSSLNGWKNVVAIHPETTVELIYAFPDNSFYDENFPFKTDEDRSLPRV